MRGSCFRLGPCFEITWQFSAIVEMRCSKVFVRLPDWGAQKSWPTWQAAKGLCRFAAAPPARARQPFRPQLSNLEDARGKRNPCMFCFLRDSGADASIFPASMSGFGLDSETPANRLQDAQGNSIPSDGMKDIEIHLMDQYGRAVVLKETVAVSSQINQPILCFGHLLENG